ncbi:protein of unknown function [Actinacidiphila yanglinensis]|uniref:DUF397 domain-containing protein n=1 Tax=Actinacidiphila yanglinensis TaxID=310779 RepID=A0A1H5W2V2_9ACTN|nr:DUF397 domain-containing protein [Actinacidiphila yanglinensis]SEF93780.1 protein of unknown function [Actinacidiphila yanglinensis]
MAHHTIPDASALTGWRKSTYSNGDGGSCVEIIDHHPTGVPVRDSKDPHGPALLFDAPAWTAFLTALKNGELS